ncbi:MAG: hypothetical protein R3C68_09890 [Myxococcota bacterium]
MTDTGPNRWKLKACRAWNRLALAFAFAGCADVSQAEFTLRFEPAADMSASKLGDACASPSDGDFFVAADGRPSGDGSRANPWDLRTALEHPRVVQPGDTIWLEGGTYNGYSNASRGLVSYLQGSEEAPIVVRAVPNQRVVIDMYDGEQQTQEYLSLVGDHVWYWGLEIMSTNPGTRVFQSNHSGTGGVYSYGDPKDGANEGNNIRMINLVIHDLSGVGMGWQGGKGGELYGTIIYNNGFIDPRRGHGHAIYTQNPDGDVQKRIIDNIGFNQFKDGCNVYGTSATHLDNFHIEGNAFFNSGGALGKGFSRSTDFLLGGGAPANNNRVIANYTYSQHVDGGAVNISSPLSSGSTDNDGLDLRDNYFAGLVRFSKPIRNLNVADNTVVGSVTGDHIPSSGVTTVARGAGSGYLYDPISTNPAEAISLSTTGMRIRPLR